MRRRASASREGKNAKSSTSSTFKSLDPVQREQVKSRFKALDKNGDGQLSMLELKEMLQQGSKNKLSDRELRVLFKQVDKDGSGTVDFDEFVDYLWATSTGKVETIDSEDVVFEVELPLDGGGLELGGKLGNVVINPGFIKKLKTGWRAVAVNGEKLEPREAADEIERMNRCWQRCTVTFEVDEQSGERIAGAMEDQLTAATREILSMVGIRDWSDVHLLSAEERQNVLKDPRLARLLVETKSVHGAALLLEIMGRGSYLENKNLVEALDNKDAVAVGAILPKMTSKELLLRDGDGNVPLHLARSEACVRMLINKEPAAQYVVNNAGRNPLNERLAQHGLACRSDLDGGEGMRQILLHCDDAAICAAMRVSAEDDLQAATRLLPTWGQVCEALDRPAELILPALEALGGEDWPGLIGFHCFREVMQEGCHTSHSWSRLRMIWWTLSRLLRGCIGRDSTCLAPAKALLKATKGPCCPPIDMRLPYRKDLGTLMNELQHDSGAEVAFHYEHLSGTGATWLKHDLQDALSDFLPNCFVESGLQSRLRMDFELDSGTAAPEKLKPQWTRSVSPDFSQILADLSEVGAVSQTSPEDALFEMLRIAGLGSRPEDSKFQTTPEDPDSLLPIIRLYAAYLRGLCEVYKDEVVEKVKEALGDRVVPGRNFFARPEVKGFPRIVVKTLEALAEIREEIKVKEIERSLDMNLMMQRSAAFVNDINGATVVCDTPEELQEIVGILQSTFPCLRVKNTYRQTSMSSLTDYRDIKLWPCVETAIGFLVIEVQLILTEGFETKKWMHLPYSYGRGDFDWRHGSGLSAEEQFFTAWRLYTGIDGGHEAEDLAEAKKFCIDAARGGHIMARAICRREGWGKFKKNDRMAMREFEEAAEAGLPEGKCKLGVSLINSTSNVERNRARAFELLRDAAKEGELEALFQLGVNSMSHRDQKSCLKKAAQLGHRRARRHPLLAVETSTRRITAMIDD